METFPVFPASKEVRSLSCQIPSFVVVSFYTQIRVPFKNDHIKYLSKWSNLITFVEDAKGWPLIVSMFFR